jgi:hypothetical protein
MGVFDNVEIFVAEEVANYFGGEQGKRSKHHHNALVYSKSRQLLKYFNCK